MRKEDFEKLYRTWDDKKLLEAFRKRSDYQQEAVEVMQAILKERNISAVVEKIIQADKEEEAKTIEKRKKSLIEEQKMYEGEMLGDYSSADTFAEKNRQPNGDYLASEIASSKYYAWRVFLPSLSMVALLLFIFAFTSNALFDYAALVFGFAFLVLVSVLIYLFIYSKASIRFYRAGTKDILEISNRSWSFAAIAPFNYFAYWTSIEHRVKGIRISHPSLALVITNKEGDTIVLRGNLTALQDHPPAWPEISQVQIPKNARFFNEIAFNRVDIIKLKKIFDGLHKR